MYKVLIDTTDRYKKAVKLIKITDGSETPVDETTDDIDVVSSIHKLLHRNNMSVSDVSEFISNRGPGSFTGIKVGVTVENVLNWALGKKDLSDLAQAQYGREPNITLKKDLA